MMGHDSQATDVNAAGGYGPPGGGGYGGPPPPPGGGGYGGPPPGGAPPGGYGPPPGGGGYGGPPGGAPPGYGGPPGGGPPGYGPPAGGYGPPGGFGGPAGFGPPAGYPTGPGQPKVHPLAITSLVLGILSIPLCCCSFFGIWAPIAAVVCGILGMNKIKAEPHLFSGNGLCIAGIVTGGFGLMLDMVAIFSTIDDSLKGQYGHF